MNKFVAWVLYLLATKALFPIRIYLTTNHLPMYKATVTKSFSDLKSIEYGSILILYCLAGATIGFFGPEFSLYSFILVLFLMVGWRLTGFLQWKPKKGELILSQNQLRLKWMDNQEIVLNLNEVSPTYQINTYRPLGILPKKSYIYFLIEGGPLGPHEFFFFHDGEYNASQWEKLPIEQAPQLDVLTRV